MHLLMIISVSVLALGCVVADELMDLELGAPYKIWVVLVIVWLAYSLYN